MEDLSAVDGGDMSDLAGRGAVLVGLAPSKLGYDKMNDAFRVLMKEETELVAIHKSKVCMCVCVCVIGRGAKGGRLERSDSKALYRRPTYLTTFHSSLWSSLAFPIAVLQGWRR